MTRIRDSLARLDLQLARLGWSRWQDSAPLARLLNATDADLSAFRARQS